jgi:hypothetical protein
VEQGWYLMSVRDLEIELARWRGDAGAGPPSNALRLAIDEALTYRNAGNLPDASGRTLRLVLHVRDDADAARIHERRLEWEPDYHDAPDWRRPGSAPVNVVPLRDETGCLEHEVAWWDDPDLAELEEEWRTTGAVAGLRVPASYRGFVYKTVLALRSSAIPITVESVVGSVSRWLGPDDAGELRRALEDANG